MSLPKATQVPDPCAREKTSVAKKHLNVEHKLTVSVFQRLLLLGGLGDYFDPLAEEDADVGAVAVEHLDRQHEVLSLVRVGYVQGFGCAIILQGGGRN